MMRRFLLAAGVCLAASTAGALEFHALGSQALSMGGAGVASERGAYAAYYNPALLPQCRHTVEVAVGAGVGLREINLASAADKLADFDLDATFDQLSEGAVEGGGVPESLRVKLAGIADALDTLLDKNGLQIMPAVSLGCNAGRFGFGVFGVSEATATAVIDPDRLDFIVQRGSEYYAYDPDTRTYSATDRADYESSSLEYAIDEGLTYVQITGLAYAEIPLAYGHRLLTDYGQFNVGGAVKIMPGVAYGVRIDVDTDTDELEEQLTDVEDIDTAFGVDAGLLYKPGQASGLSIGLVAKNLNTPSWDTPEGDTLEAKPQVRAGVAYDCLGDKVTFAADLDVTSNDTYIPNQSSQYIGGGVSLHPASWVSLRLGAMVNLQDNEDGPVLTGGLGLGLKWFQLDVSAQVATDTTEFDDTTIPRYLRGQLALVSKWY